MTNPTISLHPPYSLPPVDRRSTSRVSWTTDAGSAEATSIDGAQPFVPPSLRESTWQASARADAPVEAEPSAEFAAESMPAAAEPSAVFVADSTPVAAAEVLEGVAQADTHDAPLAPGLHPTPLAQPVVPSPEEMTSSHPVEGEAAYPVAEHEDALPSISDYLMDGAVVETDATATRWPIADVGEEVGRLTAGLPIGGAAEPRDEQAADESAAISRPDAGSEDVAPWSDDEAWLDIMPAASPSVTRELEAQTAWARAFAEPPAPVPTTPATPTGNVFTAARALEDVARRLRAGELSLPSWSAEGGDAAALAATLTALLGARR